MSYISTSAKGSSICKLAELIAFSTTFQAEAQATAAELLGPGSPKKRIHFPFLRPGVHPLLPFAILKWPEGGFEHYRVAGGDRTFTLPRGSIDLALGRAISHPDPEQAELEFTDWEEAVLVEVLDGFGRSDNLNGISVTMTRPPARSDPRKEAGEDGIKPFYVIEYRVNWDAQ
jgi:hypothetical protein